MGHMQRQVHEDVDAIPPDLLSHLFVRESRDSTPAVAETAQRFGNRIRRRHVAVRNQFYLLMIVMRHNGMMKKDWQ